MGSFPATTWLRYCEISRSRIARPFKAPILSPTRTARVDADLKKASKASVFWRFRGVSSEFSSFSSPNSAKARVLDVSQQVLDTDLLRLEGAHRGLHVQERPLEDLEDNTILHPYSDNIRSMVDVRIHLGPRQRSQT